MAVGSLKSSSGSTFRTRKRSRRCQRSTDETLGMFEGIRRLSHDLHPATLRLVGLATALKAHCVEVEKRHEVQVQLHHRGRLRRPPPRCRPVSLSNRSGVASQRRRAWQRATALCLARQIGRSRRADRDRRRPRIRPRGCARDGGGLGLVSIEERAHVVGGDVQIVTGLGQGTTIQVRAPAGAEVNAEKGGRGESSEDC